MTSILPPTEHELRQEIVRFGQLCYANRLLVAGDGNLSARLRSGDILCTPSGVHKGLLSADDLIVVDPEGRRKQGEGRPTSEILMHLACYREREDVRAVIHAHPPLCVAFTLAGLTMARCVLPEVVLTLGVVPTVPYATTGSEALAERVGEHAREYDAIIMDTHGAVTMGADLLQAFCRLETLEHAARIMKAAHDLGGIPELPPEEAVKLRRMGLDRFGGPPEALSRKDLPDAGLAGPCGAPDVPPSTEEPSSKEHTSGAVGSDEGAPAFEAPRPLRVARLTNHPVRPFTGSGDAVERHPLPGAEPGAPDLNDLVVEEVLRVLRQQGGREDS